MYTDHFTYAEAYQRPGKFRTGYLVRYDNNDHEEFSSYDNLIDYCMSRDDGSWSWNGGIKQIWNLQTRKLENMRDIVEFENANYAAEKGYQRQVNSDYYASR